MEVRSVKYQIPAADTGPKPRMVKVTSSAEIASIKRNGFNDVIGAYMHGEWWAYQFSLAQFRGFPLEGLAHTTDGQQP